MNEIVPNSCLGVFSEPRAPRRVGVGKAPDGPRHVYGVGTPGARAVRVWGDRELRSGCRGVVELHWLQQMAGDAR